MTETILPVRHSPDVRTESAATGLREILRRIRPVVRAIMARADGYRERAGKDQSGWEAACMERATNDVLGDQNLLQRLLNPHESAHLSHCDVCTESGPGHFEAYQAMVRHVRLAVARLEGYGGV